MRTPTLTLTLTTDAGGTAIASPTFSTASLKMELQKRRHERMKSGLKINWQAEFEGKDTNEMGDSFVKTIESSKAKHVPKFTMAYVK